MTQEDAYAPQEAGGGFDFEDWGVAPDRNAGPLPSSKYAEANPSPLTLRRAADPVRAVLPRKQRRRDTSAGLKGLREANPMTASLLGLGRGGSVGELLLGTTVRYKGAVVAGRPHGQGVLYEKNSRGAWCLRYTGAWCQGKRDGCGTAHYLSGEVHTGQWRNNKRHGIGEMQYVNQSTYSGSWKNDEPQGEGTLRHPNGDFFTGVFCRGRREGVGTSFSARLRRKYTAEYVADRPLCGVCEEWNGTEATGETTDAGPEEHSGACAGPALRSSLPALELQEPFQALAETIGKLRSGQGKGAAGDLRPSGAFTAPELEGLQHTFTRLAGATGTHATVKPEQFRELCMAAGLLASDPRTTAFMAALGNVAGGSPIPHDTFVEAILKFQS